MTKLYGGEERMGFLMLNLAMYDGAQEWRA